MKNLDSYNRIISLMNEQIDRLISEELEKYNISYQDTFDNLIMLYKHTQNPLYENTAKSLLKAISNDRLLNYDYLLEVREYIDKLRLHIMDK